MIGIAANADSFFWDVFWTLLIGGPIAILLSLGTLAVGQALLAIVEIYENTAPPRPIRLHKPCGIEAPTQ